MATSTKTNVKAARPLPGRQYDRYFFSWFVVFLLATVFFGFARTYFLAGVFAAPLKSPILQVHGFVFSLWMILLAVQTGLVAGRKVKLHRTLGLAGFGLAIVVFVAGILAAANQLSRNVNSPRDYLAFSAISFCDIFSFAIPVGLAYIARANSAVHKRLVIIGTIGLTGAAIDRIPLPWVYHHATNAIETSWAFLVLLALYDLWALHKIHKATLWGSVFVILLQAMAEPLGSTPLWHGFARWVQSWGV